MRPADEDPLTAAVSLPERRRGLLCRIVMSTSDVVRSTEAGLDDRFDPMLTQQPVMLVLGHLRAHGPSRPRDLRQLIGFTSGGTSNLLARLDDAGLVRRTSGDIDGDERAVLVELTADGARTSASLAGALVQSLAQASVSLKELQLTFDHLGANTSVVTLPSGPAIAPRLVRALGRVSEELATSLRATPAHVSARLVLVATGDIGPCRPRYLAERLVMSTAGITKLVDRLSAEGLVRRDASGAPGDRRAVTVRLTDRGAATLDALLEHVDARLDALADATSGLVTTLAAAAPG